MFNLGIPELLIISMAALLVFGPKRLPELAKSMGKAIRDFKKAMEEGEEEGKPLTPAATETALPTPVAAVGIEPRQIRREPPVEPVAEPLTIESAPVPPAVSSPISAPTRA